MLGQDLVNAALVLVIGGSLIFVGLRLFYRGTLRASHLHYVIYPLSLTLAFLVVAMRIPLLTTWGTRVLFSVIATALAIAPIFVVMKMKGLSVDHLEKSWRSRKKGK
jgi:hypothetical protein